MLRLWLAIGVGVVALVVSGLVATLATAQAGPDPAGVITAYEMARNRRDIDAAIAYFADDATISQRSTTFASKEDIRKFVDGISARSRFIVIADRHVSGNRVTWTERAGTQGPSPQGPSPQGQGQGQPMSLSQAQGSTGVPSGTARPFVVNVEAIVQDGKIRSLAYLTTTQPAAADPTLDGRAQLPATAGLGAVLTVLAGVLMVGSLGLHRRHASPSSLRGRLMHDLQGWSAARQ